VRYVNAEKPVEKHGEIIRLCIIIEFSAIHRYINQASHETEPEKCQARNRVQAQLGKGDGRKHEDEKWDYKKKDEKYRE
jgi:hypothetical protein